MHPILVPALAALLSSPAHAQSDDLPEGFIYRPETVLDEDEWKDLEVEGELVKPVGLSFTERRTTGFPPMFTLRTDFNAEMSESIDEVR